MQVTTSDLRREMKDVIDTLSSERLRIAADYLKFLQSLESEEEATEELMQIEGAVEAHMAGKQEIAEGKVVSWREVRRDV